VVIDGCPPRLEISEEEIQIDLDRRKPGQSRIVTPRRENDICEIISGVFEGKTLGTPIAYFSAESGCSFARLTTKRPRNSDLPWQAPPMKQNTAFATGKEEAGPSLPETMPVGAAGAIAKKNP
jgi:chorismate synthase